jgi:hypothetical protein
MRHSYFLQPGKWNVEGFFLDADGARTRAKGTNRSEHGPELWTSEGTIGLEGATPTEIRYEIAPLAESSHHTVWTSYDPVEGTIRGTIAVVEELLISSFASVTTDYHGVDVLRRTKPDRYLSRGFAMRGGTRLSSWALTLTRA